MLNSAHAYKLRVVTCSCKNPHQHMRMRCRRSCRLSALVRLTSLMRTAQFVSPSCTAPCVDESFSVCIGIAGCGSAPRRAGAANALTLCCSDSFFAEHARREDAANSWQHMLRGHLFDFRVFV